jgi:hypothetical protein
VKHLPSSTFLTSNALPLPINTWEEIIGNFFASYALVQYAIGRIIYTIRKNSAMMLIISSPGVANRLPRNSATVDQSRPKDPMPSPYTPDPVCYAMIEFSGGTRNDR